MNIKLISQFLVGGFIGLWCLTIYANQQVIPSDVIIDNLPDNFNADIHIDLQEIAANAGDTYIRVSDSIRSPKEQVERIIDYYIECNASYCGVQHAANSYNPLCLGNTLAFYKPPTVQNRSATVELMGAELETNLISIGSNRPCMKHVLLQGISTGSIVVDISPSSVDNHEKFYNAVRGHSHVDQNRFYYPDIAGIPTSPVKDAAFHIEFILPAPQPSPSLPKPPGGISGSAFE